MKISAIVQVRTSSTRLPEKVLKELPEGSGITCLEQVIRRLKQSKRLDEVIIATTTEKSDDRVVGIAKKENVKYFRGSNENVLSRYLFAAIENDVDIIVRITSDCPCIDAEIVDKVIDSHVKLREVYIDYTANTLIRTYPKGLDVEVFDIKTLKDVYRMAESDYDKEHVTPYIYNRPGTYRVNAVKAPKELYAPDIRVTLDTIEDYVFLCMLFNYLYPKNKYFNAYDIVNLLKEVKK